MANRDSPAFLPILVSEIRLLLMSVSKINKSEEFNDAFSGSSIISAIPSLFFIVL